MVHFTTCNFASSSVEVTEICNVNLCQIISTSVVCCLLIIGIFFLAFKYKKRCFTTLLYLHNYRSAVELLLFAWGSMDLAASCLPLDPQLYERRTSDYIAAPFGVFNSILTIVVTITLAIYHRIAEIKYKPESLYFSIGMELYISGVQVYKIPKVMHNHDITDLKPFFGMSLALLFTILAILDATTIYKEHLKPKEVETKLPQDKEKIGYLHSTATFISKVLFWWMTPLFWRGYKEPLEPEDLGSLREEDSTKIYYDQFLFIYKTTKWNDKPSLWLCYLKSSWKQFTLGGIFKLLGDLSALVGPLSICQIVEYIEQQYENHQDQQRQQMGNNLTTIIRQEHAWDQSDRNLPVTQDTKIYYPNWNELLSNGWIIAWIVLLASIVQGGLSQASTHLVNMIGIRIKTSLQGLIYRKTLLLSSSFLYNPEVIIDEEQAQIKGHVLKSTTATATTSASNTTKTTLSMTTTTSIKDAGAITNLMSEDALNVMSFFWIAHYVWAIPLKIGVVMYLLYRKLGISAIIGSLVCIVTMTPLQFLIGKAMSNNSEKAAECTDERLKRTNDVFLGIKLIKLNAWEKVFGDKILASRRRELKFLNRDSIYWTLMTFLTHVSSVLITFVTLAVFIKLESDNSDINKAGYTNNIYNNNNNNNSSNNNSISHSSSFINLHINKNATSHVIHDMEIDGEQKQHMEFTASRLFSALALFNQLTVPLFIFPITVPIIISAIVSTRRLERFLQEPEVQKQFEGIRNMARILSKSDASLDMYEEEEQNTVIVGGGETTATTTTARKNPEQMSKRNSLIKPTDINLISPLVAHPNRKDLSPETSFAQKECGQKRSGSTVGGAGGGKELIRNSRIEKTRFRQKSPSSRDSFQFQSMENVVVSVENSVFSWDKCNTLLKVDSLVVPKGKITIIVGKNGSGKTSLLAAFLKEMQQISGEVIWNKYSTIAYVPQIPWLLNSSIRENILFGESFRPKRYEKVLEACALKPDIELMPGGDMTVIGERGINLSGGQKQRIVIARSLYSSANVIVMDDPLSSLDNEVAKHVFENSIKKMLLKANRTVVLVTQRLQLVHSADYIIAMKDGYVQSAGTYSDIDKENPGLILEWNSIIAKGSERGQMSPGKTARERWRLFKNVSKVGLQVNQNLDQEPISSTQSLYVPSKRRVSIFGSRHLTCDMPLPIDECQNEEIVFRRRGSQRARMCASLELRSDRKNVLRVNSLQPQSGNNVRTPVSRNISSPISLYSSKNRFAENDMKSKSGFRQFLNRMSSRRSNTALNTRIHRTISASNSIKSITEESHMPVRRLMSDSSNSSDVIDDDSIEDLSDEDVQFSYDEERKYGEIATHVYMFYLKACSLSLVGIFFLSALIWQCLRVYTDAWLREWTDFEKSQDISYYFRIYSIISTICIIVALISTPAGQVAGCRARRFLHEHLLHVILSKPLHFFQTTPLGRIINRFSNDMSIIDKKIASTSQRLLQFMLLCLCAVLINTSITPWFILLTIPICAAYYIIQKFYRCSSRELQRIESITSSPVISHFTETIQGVTTIRAYSQEARFTEILFKRLETNSVAFIVLNTSNRWLGIALDYLGGFIVFVAIITALVATTTINSSQLNVVEQMEERTSPSLVGLAINYTLLVPIYLNWVVKLLADMEMYIGAVERVAYYGECDEVSETNEVIYKSVPISWPQRGDITFENVCLRYEGQTQNVIMDLSMKIPAGQRIGVCGRTGSGKSSLALSLFGVLKVVSGQIQIDDVDIAAVHPDEIRSRLSIIPQDVYLFNGTIRENLDPRSHYSDLDLWNCLEMAQLKDSVNALPRGLDTEIIDGGSNLSAGQRQLFCLARAVLRGSVCLVLDEATSSLDNITEIALLEAANKAFQGRTIITIAHRLSTLLDYDRIIVLENGRIIEEGQPQELMLKSNGRFASMLKTGNT